MTWQHVPRALALTVLCVALATACDPQDLPDARDEAWVSVRVGADADGLVTVALGGGLDDAQVSALIESLDGDVFVGRPSTGDVTGNGGGFPMVEFRSTGVFVPGDAPRVDVDTRRLCDDLMAAGFTNVDVQLSMPSVDADWAVQPGQDGTVWHIESCAESPHGEVVLRPDPALFWRELVLVLFVIACNVAMAIIGSRRLSVPRWLPWTLAATAVVAAATVIAAGGATAGDSMEVAGRIGHGANVVYLAGTLMVVLLGPIAAIAQPFYWRLPKEQRPRLRRRPPPTGTPA
jgi:hypothetical protein